MKKRIAVCALLIGVAVAQVMADMKMKYYARELGWAGAWYLGTTENLTIDEAYQEVWRSISNNPECFNMEALENFKLSKRQNALVRDALSSDYDYAAGEIYRVAFFDDNFKDILPPVFFIVVRINPDFGYTWRGFTCEFVP